jgi:hypothetical protein
VTVAKSAAATVEEYLGGLPAERRAVVAAALDLVRRHLPAGYEEAMSYGMIGWQVPLAVHPTTDNKQPLLYAALAAQKRHYALYLMNAAEDGDEERRLREAFAAAGKTLDMGKSCLRFGSMDDLVPEAVGAAIAGTPPAAFIARHEAGRRGRRG